MGLFINVVGSGQEESVETNSGHWKQMECLTQGSQTTWPSFSWTQVYASLYEGYLWTEALPTGESRGIWDPAGIQASCV